MRLCWHAHGEQWTVEEGNGQKRKCVRRDPPDFMNQELLEQAHESLQNDIEKYLMPIDDYERLEFLGDAILNFLIAEHFYKTTVNDKLKKMPKELHKMKTSVINNALLSLIVIENGIHEHVLYNNKAFSFKEQFDKYVSKVQELLQGGSTKDSEAPLDLD